MNGKSGGIMEKLTHKKIKLNSLQILALGFALLILVGAFLIMLPISNRDGNRLGFMDAFFTATSATCVTGLVMFDTYTQFNLFGQIIIIALIQIGGLGFMTIAILFSMMLRKKIGLKERSILMEAVSTWQLSGVVRLVKRIIFGTAAFEITGALLLSIRFIPLFGFAKGIWYSIFHSISAFCNAGFDLMGIFSPGSSLTYFSNDIIVNITVMMLIFCGGLGFIVWNDLLDTKFNPKKIHLHTKIILASTAFLIIFSSIFFFITEKNFAFSGMTTGNRILASLFQAITPRTAGFNTIVLTDLSEGGKFLTMLLMVIGAGPGSTGGGLKITTFFVILLSTFSYVRRSEDINTFKRRIEDSAVRKAYSSAGLYFFISCIGIAVLCISGFAHTDSTFESLSAIGTVGLSLGITPSLNTASQLALILLMYCGRVGSVSLAIAIVQKHSAAKIKNPTERIIIG